MIRSLAPGDADRCEAIIRGLPDWFGLEDPCLLMVRPLRGSAER